MSDRTEDVSINQIGEADLAERAGTEDQEAPPAEEPAKTEFIEFLGTDKAYGTEFYPYDVPGHTITRRQLKDAWDIETPKDLAWVKKSSGPHRNRMLVPVSDMSPELADALADDPMFKRVEL